MIGPERLAATQAATYKARWVDAIRDDKIATDVEVTEAILAASDTFLLSEEAVEKLARLYHEELFQSNPCKCCSWERTPQAFKDQRMAAVRVALGGLLEER